MADLLALGHLRGFGLGLVPVEQNIRPKHPDEGFWNAFMVPT